MARTVLPPLPVRIVGSDAIVPLGNGGEAIVEAADAEFAGRWRWVKISNGPRLYVVRNRLKCDGPGPAFIYLHVELAGFREGLVVDHWDGDGFNCRRGNLRHCTSRQNFQNAKRRRPGLKGAYRNSGGSWTSSIMVMGVKIYLGCFATAEEAHAAYVAAALEHFGEFARAA